MRQIVNLDISPLGERHYTGIPNVARFLAQELLGDTSVDGVFWINRQPIPSALVEHIVGLDGCPPLWWLAGRMAENSGFRVHARPSVGIYPSHKWHQRFFAHETLIVHDLTAVTLPQFHTEATVAWENSRLLPDILSSDLIVAVSESTRRDIVDYFPEARSLPITVVPLAPCSMPPERVPRIDAPPYVVVLGTLEPRKNVEAVLEMLRLDPAWLETMIFLFVGRWGWGDKADALIQSYGLKEYLDRGRIQFSNYVSNDERDVLLANAKCAIYPSRYEGFGLPVLEALSFGTPVVTGRGSSLPEAGGPCALYVDVASPEALSVAVASAISGDTPEVADGRRRWAGNFSWRKTYERIRDAALAGMDQSFADHA